MPPKKNRFEDDLSSVILESDESLSDETMDKINEGRDKMDFDESEDND